MEAEGNRLNYPLLDNALDFLLSAAEHAGQDKSNRSWKYAILHLVAGIELLLKARLELEHWSLVFQDIDKANDTAFKSGDFRSADFESLCNRLDRISAICIERNDRKQLDDLRKLRNKLEHFGIDISLMQVKSLAAKGLSFALAFFESNFGEEARGIEAHLLSRIVVHLREFEEFVTERLNAVVTNITPGATIRDCPRCFQETLEADNEGMLRCHFCGYRVEAEAFAAERSDSSLEVCPECGREALAFIVYNNESAGWECFACNTQFDRLQHCGSCGELHSGDGPICHECMSYIINKDNS